MDNVPYHSTAYHFFRFSFDLNLFFFNLSDNCTNTNIPISKDSSKSFVSHPYTRFLVLGVPIHYINNKNQLHLSIVITYVAISDNNYASSACHTPIYIQIYYSVVMTNDNRNETEC
ncbi:hypothetical protein QTP88_012906 [Uroleucon formosanum]